MEGGESAYENMITANWYISAHQFMLIKRDPFVHSV